MDCKSNFKTLVVIDLETTGLTYDEPKITELAMVAVCLSVDLGGVYSYQW